MHVIVYRENMKFNWKKATKTYTRCISFRYILKKIELILIYLFMNLFRNKTNKQIFKEF